jgi:ABC-type transporter Mla maintaining outer membrane lipid asymmetry ATPase subunit MlaF
VNALTKPLAIGVRDLVVGFGSQIVLDHLNLDVYRGEILGLVGASGGGKSVLLRTIIGLLPKRGGNIEVLDVQLQMNGPDAGAMGRRWGILFQQGALFSSLTVLQNVQFPMREHLSVSQRVMDEVALAKLEMVGLKPGDAEKYPSELSGGMTKRVALARSLALDPELVFLDEPTSGLDPVTSAELIVRLRQLADRSATVVFTTHSIEDLAVCDRIVFMSRGGRVAYVGTLDEALERFGVGSVPELYRCLATSNSTSYPTAAARQVPEPDDAARDLIRRPVASGLTQWGVLARRTVETFLRNRLTLAILIGSPALVVAMFAILFRPGAFDLQDPSPSSMVMIGFWVVFAAFFFGITYGLLQICTERTIVHRERLVGLRLGAYVASKVTVLVPFLLLVIVSMLGVLRLLDRLPSRPPSTYASMTVSLLLCSVAALGLGLLTSAAVGNVAQATLALPMLCFPAVLFSGAILPVHLMAGPGAALSTVIPSRWAFEAIGHDLGARQILAVGGSTLGRPLLASYGDAGTASTGTYWMILAVFAAVFLVGTWAVLVRSTRRSIG